MLSHNHTYKACVAKDSIILGVGVWLESDFWRKYSILIFKGRNVQEHILNPEDEDNTLPRNVRFHHSLMRHHIPREQNHHAYEI